MAIIISFFIFAKGFFIKTKLFFHLFLLSFFIACADKIPYKHAFGVHVAIKSPDIRFNDLGFLRQNDQNLKLELYNASHEILSLKISEKICLKSACFSPKEFNKRFFKADYDENILKKILTSSPIFNKKNLSQKENGFIQEVKNSHENIYYEVINQQSVIFKDKKRNIFIKLKYINH